MCIESKTLPQRAIHRHIPQSCAERFFDAFFVVVSMKGGQSKLGRLEKLRIKNFCWSPHGRIKSRHVVTSDYCFAHFQKWKCSGLFMKLSANACSFSHKKLWLIAMRLLKELWLPGKGLPEFK